MPESLSLAADGETILAAYERDGFVVPLDILGPAETRALRDDLEAAEAELADDPERSRLLRAYPDRLPPSTRSSATGT